MESRPNMKRWLLLGPMILLTLMVYFYFSLGFYKPVEIELIENVQMELLAQPHEGAYYKILPVIQSVETWAKSHNVGCVKTFGEYLDDPRAVDEIRLRSFGGCVLEQTLTDVEAPMVKRTYTAPKAVRARFFGSPSIGPFTVYPQVFSWMAERKLQTSGPTIEIYIPNESKFMTEFYFPVVSE